jgi:hypothetical protein
VGALVSTRPEHAGARSTAGRGVDFALSGLEAEECRVRARLGGSFHVAVDLDARAASRWVVGDVSGPVIGRVRMVAFCGFVIGRVGMVMASVIVGPVSVLGVGLCVTSVSQFVGDGGEHPVRECSQWVAGASCSDDMEMAEMCEDCVFVVAEC